MPSPPTGVAVIITHHQKILIGLRHKETPPCWQLPGGFMQCGETPLQAIKRQSYDKTHLIIQHEKLVALTNNIFTPSNHTISLIFQAKCKDSTKLIEMESNDGTRWHWKTWGQLPSPLFLPLQTIINSGYHPFALKNEGAYKNSENNCFIF